MCFQLENSVRKTNTDNILCFGPTMKLNGQSRWSKYVDQGLLLKAAHTPHDGTKVAEPLGSQAVARKNAAKKQART